jgi:eukaryotic-like serine/threonine-protein kinase
MGDVYRARDTRLDRIVAVKVSKENFSERVEREARAAAALNHHHICTLHDVGPNFLVMEYVEGTPLAGPLPLEQALKYAAQICEALEAAHKKGVTHRDLKPANIMVTKSGGVKLLDFGLAKLNPAIVGSDGATMALTGVGQIVGTLNYMSPEQVQGQEAGPASDIFSFGLVLYEMVTGKRAFDGTNPASVIAAILERPTPSVADVAPGALDRALKRCLEKDPDNRWQSARDLRTELEWIASQRLEHTKVGGTPAVGGRTRSVRAAFGLAAVMTIAAVGFAYIALSLSREAPRKLSMSIVPDRVVLAEAGFAMSPDGQHLAFIAGDETATRGQIWIRDLDSPIMHGLPLTAGMPASPFWSPDNRWIGYEDNGTLKKVAVAGGPPIEVVNLTGAGFLLGLSWGANDTIVFGTSAGVMRVPASGGTPSLVAQARGAVFPWFFPDGRHFMFSATDANGTFGVHIGDVEATDPARNAQPVLVPGPPQPAYSLDHLLFVRNGTLMAQPFDITRWSTSGDPVVIADRVDNPSPWALFSVSGNGVLAYTSGAMGRTQLTWFDRSGKPMGTVGKAGVGYSATISPDGSSVAFDQAAPPSDSDVWVYDVARGTESRLTSGPIFNAYPIWSPDSTTLLYWAFRDGIGQIIKRARGGTGPESVLSLSELPKTRDRYPSDWSRDGRHLILTVSSEKTKQDIWVSPLSEDQDQKAFKYLASEFNEGQGKLSPNGQWMAYSSDETNRYEVYVQTFPQPSEKTRISTNGGGFPIWSRDGKELYFLSVVDGNQTLTAIPVEMSGETFRSGQAKTLFPVRLRVGGLTGYSYDVSRDGRFLIPQAQNERVPFTVVVNWQAGLKK